MIAAWVLGGVYALIGTLCVVELGTSMPEAGGWYVYSRHVFGRYAGFLIGWCDWVMQSAALAYLSIAIGEFAVALFPAIPGGVSATGVFSLMVFAFIQWRGLRSSSRTQEITSLAKGIALLAFVAACFLLSPARETTVSVALPSGFSLAAAFILALQSVIIAYDGWYTAIYFTEEDKDPARNLPPSAIGGVLATIAIYLLVNIGLLAVLPVGRIAGLDLPAADVAQVLFGGLSGKIITALSLIMMLSVVNAVLLLATRILYGLSRDHLFFPQLARVTEAGTPLPAMLLTTCVSMALVLSGTFEKLIAMVAFFVVFVYSSGFLALLVLRKREPDRVRPFKVWGYPWTPLIALAGSIAFLVGNIVSDPRNSLHGTILIALNVPVFLLVRRYQASKRT